MLKSADMKQESLGIGAVFARGWRAIVRAFTTTEAEPGAQSYGADSTLFGAASEQGTSRRNTDGNKDGSWDPTGESTDFADPDFGGDSRRR